ncbi:hypothetical protein V473_23430 [Sphingobium cupriresistens LL01]|uniref:Uncharacterized protein n=1 Tax=Sphingobium cupriresistens LL01 TaxID=1420583 RepID=A0A0J7XKF9_9SPHN|nr:hypothetical protein V473_23430 [Sphingobium cupriresistens LL01]
MLVARFVPALFDLSNTRRPNFPAAFHRLSNGFPCRNLHPRRLWRGLAVLLINGRIHCGYLFGGRIQALVVQSLRLRHLPEIGCNTPIAVLSRGIA